MPTHYALETIIGLLDQHHQRATYGAFAALLGVQPQSVMRGLPRQPRYSWVVNAETELPTGYAVSEVHPQLQEHAEVLDTPELLIAWLELMQEGGAK